jgi:hypothetical protein
MAGPRLADRIAIVTGGGSRAEGGGAIVNISSISALRPRGVTLPVDGGVTIASPAR